MRSRIDDDLLYGNPKATPKRPAETRIDPMTVLGELPAGRPATRPVTAGEVAEYAFCSLSHANSAKGVPGDDDLAKEHVAQRGQHRQLWWSRILEDPRQFGWRFIKWSLIVFAAAVVVALPLFLIDYIHGTNCWEHDADCLQGYFRDHPDAKQKWSWDTQDAFYGRDLDPAIQGLSPSWLGTLLRHASLDLAIVFLLEPVVGVATWVFIVLFVGGLLLRLQGRLNMAHTPRYGRPRRARTAIKSIAYNRTKGETLTAGLLSGKPDVIESDGTPVLRIDAWAPEGPDRRDVGRILVDAVLAESHSGHWPRRGRIEYRDRHDTVDLASAREYAQRLVVACSANVKLAVGGPHCADCRYQATCPAAVLP
jgi:hypothetical protein